MDAAEKSASRGKYKIVKYVCPYTRQKKERREKMTAQEVFDKMCKQISPLFDAPSFAEDWAEVAKKEDGIRVDYVAARRKTGFFNKKTGKETMRWKPWDGQFD